MRSCGLSALFSLLLAAEVKLLAAEVTPSVPAGWKVIKDSKGACQIAVPADWTPSENPGSAAFQDATIAVVTNQPGQTLKPLSESMQKILGIAKDKLFENTIRRIYYQDKVARNATDSNAFIAMVPGKSGTCSSRVVFLSVVPEDTAKKNHTQRRTGAGVAVDDHRIQAMLFHSGWIWAVAERNPNCGKVADYLPRMRGAMLESRRAGSQWFMSIDKNHTIGVH